MNVFNFLYDKLSLRKNYFNDINKQQRFLSSNHFLNTNKSQQSIASNVLHDQGITWVFIWQMQSDNVGHVAIQVGGTEPKRTVDGRGEYISIHPKLLPSVGITSILPLSAKLADTITDDIETASSNSTIINDDQIPKRSNDVLAEPDIVLKFHNLDNKSMLQYIQHIKEKVTTNEVAYQLFPNIDSIGFIITAASFINQDPVDIILALKSFDNLDIQTQPYNCTSLVRDILEKGGLLIPESKLPWQITPNGLENALRTNQKEPIEESIMLVS